MPRPDFFVEPNFEVASLLKPRSDMADDQRITKLLENGFVCLYDSDLAFKLDAAGAVLARAVPSLDGAHWPMTRGIWAEDGYARLVHGSDLVFYKVIEEAMRELGLPEFGVAVVGKFRGSFHNLQNHLRQRGFNDDELCALETVARLGDAKAVLDFILADR